MSKLLSVSGMKGSKRRPAIELPREGTYLREVYDALMSNRGRVTTLHMPLRSLSGAVLQLEIFYGLDIRRAKHHRQYCLVGEWVGRAYIDYVAERNKL